MSYEFLSGVISAGYWVSTLFFLRFWRRTGAILFAWFAAGFAILGLQPLTGSLLENGTDEAEPYLLRLAGFSLIIVGVAAANRRRPLNPAPDPE